MTHTTQNQTIDSELQDVLRQNDPAQIVDAHLCGMIEMRVTAALLAHPQAPAPIDFTLLPLTFYNRWTLPWPAAVVMSVVLGLAIGLGLSFVSETPAQSYTVASAMSGPWYSETQ